MIANAFRAAVAPGLKVAGQLLAHPATDAQQKPAQHRSARGLKNAGRNEPQQGRLTHLHGQLGLSLQAGCRDLQPGMETELEVIHQAQALELAVDCLQFQAAPMVAGLQLHDGLDLELKHLDPGHGVAVMAGAEGNQMTSIEESRHHPGFVIEVFRQQMGRFDLGKTQLLTGAEGQGHGLGADRA